MKDDVMLAKWLNDELKGAELQEFMAAPEFDTYRKIKEYSAQLAAPGADMDALYQKIDARKNRPVKVRKLTPSWASGIAAALLIAIGAAIFLYTTHTTSQMAGISQRTEFLLPDNSAVMLNAGTEAEYKTWNWDNNRKLKLNGEAYFKVAKGKTFDVVTPNGTVTVVGTQFNVKSRDGRLDVTCYEGKVRVTSNKESVLITPGQSISFVGKNRIDIPSDDEIKQPDWLNHEASFYRELPRNILKEMERQYNVTITAPANLTEKPYTGTIPMNDIDTSLDMIKTVLHLKSQKTGNKIVLTSE